MPRQRNRAERRDDVPRRQVVTGHKRERVRRQQQRGRFLRRVRIAPAQRVEHRLELDAQLLQRRIKLPRRVDRPREPRRVHPWRPRRIIVERRDRPPPLPMRCVADNEDEQAEGVGAVRNRRLAEQANRPPPEQQQVARDRVRGRMLPAERLHEAREDVNGRA